MPNVTLVTGSSGMLGSSVVTAFLERGQHVAGLDRHEQVVRHANFRHFSLDLQDELAVEQAVETIASSGPIDHVVCLAGGAVQGEAPAGSRQLPSVKTFESALKSNLVTQYITIKFVTDALRKGTGDRSISMCGAINAQGPWSKPAYSAAKAGLNGLLPILADILGADGVRVNVILPGTIRTNESGDAASPIDRALVATSPLGRLGTPAQIAGAFVHLALDLTHIHGQAIAIDGGQSTRRGLSVAIGAPMG